MKNGETILQISSTRLAFGKIVYWLSIMMLMVTAVFVNYLFFKYDRPPELLFPWDIEFLIPTFYLSFTVPSLLITLIAFLTNWRITYHLPVLVIAHIIPGIPFLIIAGIEMTRAAAIFKKNQIKKDSDICYPPELT